jgi:hypothetical protein
VNNDPVNYIDLWGLSGSDAKSKWIDNGDGTYTAKEGATLYGLYGENWAEMSGFTRDPRTLQIGETVGIKNDVPMPSSGIPSSASSGGNNTSSQPACSSYVQPSNNGITQPSNNNEQQNGFSRGENIAIGVGQMVVGTVVATLGAALFFSSNGLLFTFGTYLFTSGVSFSAYGLYRIAGNHDRSFKNDAIDSITPSYVPVIIEIIKYITR